MPNVTCNHCHLEFSESVMIKEGDLNFCCKGCQGVYHLLSDEGLDSFYNKMGQTKLDPPKERYEDSANFDSKAFYERFVTLNDEGFSEVSLIIEGIHCAACVWLNEKALHKMEGVVDAHINYTNSKARITWSDSTVKLSEIIDMIRAIGYNAFGYDRELQESRANSERKEYYLRMAVATFASMNIMWIAVAQYAGYFTGIRQDVKTILNVAEWVLATPVLFYSGWIFFRGAYFGIRNKIVNMDILVATGASLTYVYSIYITLLQKGEAYFDSVAMIITFVLLGKFLEKLSKKNAADTLDIISKHVPNEVKIQRENEIINLNVNEVNVGDIIIINAGEKAAIDGSVLEGEGSFDESSLTGESDSIFKSKEDKIISGTTSIDANIKYLATKDFSHSTLSNLMNLLETSMAKKPHIEQVANKLSEYFSSVILALSFITFVVWYFWPHSFEVSFMVGISVIIIACPCALALATPVATLVGLGLGAKRGILFKEAAQLETLAKIDTLVVDKTGTLTEATLHVSSCEIEGYDELLYSLTCNSHHPVSKAISTYLSQENSLLTCKILDEVETLSARGLKASYQGDTLLGGNLALMRENGINIESDKEYGFYFAVNSNVVGKILLRDTIKEDAKKSIQKIQKLGIEVTILSGDNEAEVKRVATELGVVNFAAHFSPTDKVEYVSRLQNEGKKVMMAGDGVNDILALSKAEIAVAMGSGSDIAIDVSDVVLLNSSLTSLHEAFKISNVTYSLIKQNLAISLIYNAVTIPLAMMGYIIPLIAAISMSISSLLVVGNSMRIKSKSHLKG